MPHCRRGSFNVKRDDRGLDVIAIVGHNQTAVTLFESILSSDVIVLPGVEVGNAGLHLIAAGVRETIDWRLRADEAIDATHREGGVAIAAHPGSTVVAHPQRTGPARA